MQIKKKISNLIVLSSILVLLSLSPILQSNTLIGSTKTPFNKESPKTSGFWNLPFIHVDNNWSVTSSTYDWCTGSGSWSDPYIIENVTIDAGADGSCMIIQNSNDYFLINNCTLTNSGTSGYDAGITLNQANNGRIEKTNCSTNYLGIYLHMSENNTIDSNIINSNLGSGIVLYYSKNNTFIGNNESGSWYYGLFINSVSDNNRIIGNTFNNNTGAATYGDGIRIVASVNCTIYGNTLRYNEKGLIIDENSHNNTVENNLIKDNTDYGILINNNTKSSIDNKIYNNKFENPAGINGYDNGTNTQWSLGTLGNYWHDYIYDDLDDDGIGDHPYIIAGDAGSQDDFPIWDDGDDTNPIITLNSPSGGTIFGTEAPIFNLTIFDLNLNMLWYVLNETTINYFFTPTNGINLISIDQAAWDSFSNGSIICSFFINDTAGNSQNLHITLNKEISSEEPPPTTPQKIPFGNYYILFLGIGIISLLLLENRKRKK